MKCERCGDHIQENDEREFHGQMICEDCYMVALSPAKACDPWAVYNAKSFSEKDSSQCKRHGNSVEDIANPEGNRRC